MTTEDQLPAERDLHDRLREPEEHFADGRQALEELRAKAAAQQQGRPSDVSRARALRRLAAGHRAMRAISFGLNVISEPAALSYRSRV